MLFAQGFSGKVLGSGYNAVYTVYEIFAERKFVSSWESFRSGEKKIDEVRYLTVSLLCILHVDGTDENLVLELGSTRGNWRVVEFGQSSSSNMFAQ